MTPTVCCDRLVSGFFICDLIKISILMAMMKIKYAIDRNNASSSSYIFELEKHIVVYIILLLLVTL